MENNFLPAVRVPLVPSGGGEGGYGALETPIVDLPPSEKFGFAYPDNPMVTPSLSGSARTPPADAEMSEHEISEAESQDCHSSPRLSGGKDSADHTPTTETPGSNQTPMPSPSPPRLSRAFSMPIPSQLGHLRNPYRTPIVNAIPNAYFVPPSPLVLADSPNARLQELSVELADSVQMVIQTLLQISPPHLLDPAKEQFSPCSLSIPSPSVSALLTAMKNLNYMSANMSTLADDIRSLQELTPGEDFSLPKSPVQNDFDVGELLQSVGDALSGAAAEAGAELVLYHADVGMKHVSLRGDESGLSFALSHIIRQILNTADSGDTLEVGLSISPETRHAGSSSQLSDDDESRSSSRASSLPDDGTLRCTFEVGHKFGSSESIHEMESNPHVTAETSLFRAKPRLDTILFRRLLHQIGGTIKEDLQPRLFSPGRSCELSVVLAPGSTEILSQPPRLSLEEQNLRQPYASMNIQLASEPSLEELLQFSDTLKGKKVALYASARGSFAHHLTSYLTAWGLDVSHMTVMVSDEDVSGAISGSIAGSADEASRRTSPSVMMTDSPAPMEIDPVEEQLRRENFGGGNTAFIIIDDDVDALRGRLVRLRSEASFNLKRPKLAAHHRPKSSPQIVRAKGLKQTNTPQQTTFHPVIIHFTSLQNYRLVKDLIHTILSPLSPSTHIPEIIVLPKPAGPRRVLTALRTAVIKPIVDPFFSPIATSPMSPNGQGVNPFSYFGAGGSPLQKTVRPAVSPRTASDRSMRSSKDGVEFAQRHPPSPLRESDSMEYFSEAAEKLGTSPSSGLVIQSPDGQPAGIFFHPRGANSRSRLDSDATSTVVSPPNVARDTGNLRLPGEHRRSSLQRRGTFQLREEDMSPGERPKLLSRPRAAQHRSNLAYFNDDHMLPSEVCTPAQSPIQRSNRILDSALDGPASVSGIGPESAVPIAPDNESLLRPSGPSANSDRKSLSPPTSPVSRNGGTAKRGLHRRGTAEHSQTPGTPSGRKGKPSADGNIVPPVNVLIVEDNPINQTILSTFMRKKKIKYDVAKNGAEAVAKWKSGGFHLILMDIQMPVMDGIQATKEIRKLERQAAGNIFASTPPAEGERTPSDAPSSESKSSTGAQTPFRSSVIIVALTASSLQTDRVAALAAGCNDFLTKPVSLLWLNNKIIEWGSIKALQMWADLRPEVMKNITSGQAKQARTVASKLHVPENRRNRSPPAPTQVPRATPAQIEAMRRLSSASKIPIFRGLDPIESDHSDMENRIAPPSSIDTEVPNTPLASTESGSSGASSVPADTPPEGILKACLSLSDAHKEVSGEEALQAHIKDSAVTASAIAEREASGRPVVLGERTISGTPATIAELMHDDIEPVAKVVGSDIPGTKSSEVMPDVTMLEQSPDALVVLDDKDEESAISEHHDDH